VHAFDYVIVLFSFVYAAAVTHVLATLGDLIIAGRRIRVSSINVGWMLSALLSILTWWLGTWELRQIRTWDSLFILFNFIMACALYLVVRLTCPPVPSEGPADLQAFHETQGRKYMGAYAAFGIVAMAYNAVYAVASNGSYFLLQDIAVAPMVAAALAAAVFIRSRTVQAISLAVQFAAWGLYFARFQGVLTG
jgi:hypothetical protein